MFAVNSDPDWSDGRAACVGQWDLHAPRDPEPGHREDKAEMRERIRAALDVCKRCPMLDECRAWTFQNRPHGTVSGGMDLTGQTPDLVASLIDDASIYWQRIYQIAEGAGVELNAYQTRYVDSHLKGRPMKWQNGGGRPLALRAQCEWLLDHPHVGFQRAA